MVNKFIYALIIFLYASLSFATNYYVRPTEGEYGAEDGSSYAAAYDGFSDINWADVDSGDGRLFVCGSFTDEQLTIGASGESGYPVYVANCTIANGAGVDDPATIDGSGLSLDQYNGLVYINGKSYITIDGIAVQYSDRRGIAAINASDNIIIQNCTTYDTDEQGIIIGSSTNFWLLGNTVQYASKGSSGECITVQSSGTGYLYRNTVKNGGNTSGEQVGGEGIDIKDGSTNVWVEYNEVYDIPYEIGIYIDGFSGDQYNIYVGYNKVYRCGNGGIVADVESAGNLNELYIYGNLVYDIDRETAGLSGHGIHIKDSGANEIDNVYIYNNTVFDNGNDDSWGRGIVQDNEDATVLIKNNIVSNNYTGSVYVCAACSATVDYNLIEDFKGDTNETRGTNYIESDPSFTDESNYIFTLQSDSPAINAAVSISNYDQRINPSSSWTSSVSLCTSLDMGAFADGCGNLGITATGVQF